MKKLIVLILFMLMVAVASAGIYNPGYYITVAASDSVLTGATFSVSVNVGTGVTLGVFSGGGGNLAQMTVTGGTVSNVNLTTPGDWASTPTPGISATSTVISITAEADGLNPIGTGTVLFTFDVTAGGIGTLIIDASSGRWAGFAAASGSVDGFNDGVTAGYEIYSAGYKEVTVTPEPMTLALLGLGGLILRRRRKA